MKSPQTTSGYIAFLEEVKGRILSARFAAGRAVNRELVLLCWDIGRGIADRQRTLVCGDSVVTKFASVFRAAHPEMQGFSDNSVWLMRQLYLKYSSSDFLEQPVQVNVPAKRRGKMTSAQRGKVLAFVVFLGLLCPLYGESDDLRIMEEGKVLWDAGKYQEALPFYERALVINEQSRGPAHPSTAVAHSHIASLYVEMGEYGKALPVHERVLAIMEKSFGMHHPHTASALHRLTKVYSLMGDYSQALPLCERALAIREKSLGPEHLETGRSLLTLAAIYVAMGDYTQALPMCERGLAISEKSLGPEHPEIAASLNSLAVTYGSLGNHAKALPLNERALAICETSFGPEHPETGRSLNSLSANYVAMGDYAQALPLRERALAIREKSLGPEHPETGRSLLTLAATYVAMGDYTQALPMCERALAIFEKSLGPEHPDTAASLQRMADACFSKGDYAQALPLYERGLAIREKSLGPAHPETAGSLNEVAVIAYLTGDTSSARQHSSKHIAAIQRQQQTILTLDERSRLAWQSENVSFWSACVLRSEPLAQLVLRQKGVVLDSILEDRSLAISATTDPEGRAKLEEIAVLRSKLAEIIYDESQRSEVARIQEQIGQIQRSLSTRANIGGRVRQNADITIDAILPSLSKDSVLVDFIEFPDLKLKGDEAVCYGALIVAGDGSPTFVRIDGAIAIDTAIDALRTAIVENNKAEVEKQTRFLSEKLWQPIAWQFPEGTRQVFLCPEAKLNFLSFSALDEGDGVFVAEKYSITYLGSSRDLARRPSDEKFKTLAIFANPAFDESGATSRTTKDMVAMRAGEADTFGAIVLPPLPGTETEGKTLEATASKAGWQARSLTGSDATETSVRQTEKPGVLHLATHGFYLNTTVSSPSNDSRGMSVAEASDEAPRPPPRRAVDPMRASGVALTGAQQTLKLWSQRKAPDPETDGILTAEEVASLDLNGTWLVTLSACETGVGEARSGEGVFGLRRAFMMAGAENLLMTLWPVADDTTASIMADFYKEALATGDAPGSLAKVQRDWLVKLREEKGLATAIREAGPFAMVMMTAPTHQPVELPPIAKLEAIDTPTSTAKTQPAGESAPEKKSGWWPF